ARLQQVREGEDFAPPSTPMEDLLTLQEVGQQERQRAVEREQRADQSVLNDVIAEQRQLAQEREQQQPIVTDEPNIQEAVSRQQEVRQDVQESRELPVVQEQPPTQAQETTIDSQGEATDGYESVKSSIDNDWGTMSIPERRDAIKRYATGFYSR